MNMIMELLQYTFVQYALITGVFIAGAASIVGVFLVMKRLSLLSDSLSHISLSGVALGFLLNKNPLYTTLPIVVLSSLGIITLSRKTNIYTDSSIGIIGSFGMSVGLIIIAFSNGFNSNLFGYLFGSILAISHIDIVISFLFFIFSLLFIYLFYRDIMSVIFDREYAKTNGVNVTLIENMYMVMASVLIALGIKIVGILLITAMIIIPPNAALQISSNFKQMIIFSMVFSAISVVVGMLLSFMLDIPSGAGIVLVNIACLIITFALNKVFKIKN